MKYIVLLSVILPWVLYTQNSAPADYAIKSIKLENNQSTFLQLSSSTITPVAQSGWDIALYNEGHEIGGKVNEGSGVRVWRVFKDTLDFSSINLSDTLYPFQNSDSFAYLGALDTIYTGSTSTFFKIGIGKFYFGANYSVVPNRIYIIQKEDGSFGKFFISYADKIFRIRYANIDNTSDKTIIVTKISPLTKHYQYLNFSTSTISSDFEIRYDAWDLVFRKYTRLGVTYPIGVLTNNAYNLIRYSKSLNSFSETLPDLYLKYGISSTECYEAQGNTLTVSYNGSLSTMEPISRLNNQIGERWYNPTTILPTKDVSYYLRDKSGMLWHIIFTNFDASTNTVSIAYKSLGNVVSIMNSGRIDDILISQSDDVLTIVDKSANFPSNGVVGLFDMQGKIISQGVLSAGKLHIDISKYRNSIVFLQVMLNQTKLETVKIGLR